MSRKPAVSVVIPTHNRRRLLLRTLTSVLNQEAVRQQVVVVDDGGVDGTADEVRRMELENVHLLRHQRSKGVAAARNAGLALADTPWVAFVDDDDVWAPGKLRAQLASLDENSDARWSAVGACTVDQQLRILSLDRPPLPQDVAARLLESNAIPGGGSGVLVDTPLAKEVGGFDESLSITADWDFYLRLGRESPLAVVDDFLMAYYTHSDSMFHDPAGLMRELLYMEDKHQGADGLEPLRLDYSFWSVDLAWMAHRLGDRRTAGILLRQGVRQAGVLPVVLLVGRRGLGKLGRTIRPTRPPEAPAWLALYA